jgi:pyruvate/2-oxoglutarate dehydrogenase complex dihydrolipoamide acyltransferase (E2) component
VKLTGWRRIAAAIWRGPADPQIYGTLEVDAAPITRMIERARAQGVRVTPTVVVGRAIAHALRAVPDLNVRLVGGHAVPRPSIDVFFIAAVGGGNDLSGVKVTRVDEKGAIDVARELAGRSARAKRGDDPEFLRTKRLMEGLPMALLRPIMRMTAFAANQLDLDLPALGVHRAPFGSAMITSVGMFGLPGGFAPLAWMYGVPLLVTVGLIEDRPVVDGGRVIARPTLPLTATIDHRYVDGWHISRAMAAFRDYLAAPEAFEPSFAQAPRAMAR